MGKTNEARATFGSKLGIILASAGSAVGLGNIWRFPCEVGENGGAAFILIYFLCVFCLGVPVMMSEFVIGRHARANTATAYEKLAPGTPWKWVGVMGVLAAFLILSYYAVVAGWTLEYTYAAATSSLGEGVDYAAYFNNFVSHPWRPVLFLVCFLLVTNFIVVRGIKDGIEKCSKVMMPMLLLIIGLLVLCSLSMPGSGDGLRFLLMPDFGKIDTGVILSAMGQAFFSLSLGMGCLCTYASYFSADANLGKTAVGVASIDTTVAVTSGLFVFPAVFSVTGLAPDAGPGLVFITLPNVFHIAFGSLPWLAWGLSVMFYVLLVLAALTSTISLLEVPTAFLSERFGLSRGWAASLVTAGCGVLGTLCALSFGVLSGEEYRIFGLTIFDAFDFVTAKYMMPLGGMLISIFAGWYLDRKLVWEEVTNGGRLRIPLFKVYIFFLRFVAPLAIGSIFVNELLNA